MIVPIDLDGMLGVREQKERENHPWRPEPRLDGSLVVDPDIHLPSPGMDVDLTWYYSSQAKANGPYGYGRNIGYGLTAQASGSPVIVTMTRGDMSNVVYQSSGGSYVPLTPGVFNTLVQDTGNSLWEETTPDGKTTAYPLDTTGQITSAVYVQDSVGNIQTLTYSGGLLTEITDGAGRIVSLSYSGGLLQTIRDWANRVTTFAYDTTSGAPLNLLTSVTGPTGCQTQYQNTTLPLWTFRYPAGYDWFVSGILDPNGYGTSYLYDRQGRRRIRRRSYSV